MFIINPHSLGDFIVEQMKMIQETAISKMREINARRDRERRLYEYRAFLKRINKFDLPYFRDIPDRRLKNSDLFLFRGDLRMLTCNYYRKGFHDVYFLDLMFDLMVYQQEYSKDYQIYVHVTQLKFVFDTRSRKWITNKTACTEHVDAIGVSYVADKYVEPKGPIVT